MFVEASYVQISRDDLEDWLDSLGFRNWYLKEGRAGMYVIPLSDHVGIVLSSTIGSRDDAMGKGRASMKLRLESLHNGYVLNKKAMGQSHFKRTTNWRNTWKKGIERMKKAYTSSQGFYDELAQIDDRDEYKHKWLKKIESAEGWVDNSFLSDLHSKLENGGILTTNQKKALIKAVESGPKHDQSQDAKSDEHRYLGPMREVWKKARRNSDDWTMNFVESLADQLQKGRTLSTRQRNVLKDKFEKYGVPLPE